MRKFVVIASVALAAAGCWLAWRSVQHAARHDDGAVHDVQASPYPPEYGVGIGARAPADARTLDSYATLKREPEGSNSQGPAPCLACRDLKDGGAEAWGVTEDGEHPAHASVTGLASGKSNTVRFTMGGNHFSLAGDPAGVLVQIKWSGAPNRDALVRLTCNGSPLGGNKAADAMLPGEQSFTSYGGRDDAWGADITHTQANDPSFGVEVVVDQVSYGAVATIAEIDITVYESGADAATRVGMQNSDTPLGRRRQQRDSLTQFAR